MKNVLVVVDVQNDFVDQALGTKEAQQIIPHVIQQIQDESYDTVIATMDTHDESYLQTFEGRHLPVTHCIKPSEGWQIYPSVKEALDDRDALVIEKPTFASEKLVELLRQQKPACITLIGLCTDICVLSNAITLRAALPETEICIIADACAGVTPVKHEAALEVMASCQIDIVKER